MDTDLSFIKDDATRFYVEDAYKAVSSIDGAWDFMKEFTPAANDGWMFSRHPMLDKIGAKLHKDHSGASYGYTMRQMEYIAKNGLEAYKNIWIKTNNQ